MVNATSEWVVCSGALISNDRCSPAFVENVSYYRGAGGQHQLFEGSGAHLSFNDERGNKEKVGRSGACPSCARRGVESLRGVVQS